VIYRLIDLRTFSAGFHAAGDVDCVAKETVSRHCDSDHSADHRAAVKAAAYHQLAIWTVSNLHSSTGVDEKNSSTI